MVLDLNVVDFMLNGGILFVYYYIDGLVFLGVYIDKVDCYAQGDIDSSWIIKNPGIEERAIKRSSPA